MSSFDKTPFPFPPAPFLPPPLCNIEAPYNPFTAKSVPFRNIPLHYQHLELVKHKHRVSMLVFLILHCNLYTFFQRVTFNCLTDYWIETQVAHFFQSSFVCILGIEMLVAISRSSCDFSLGPDKRLKGAWEHLKTVACGPCGLKKSIWMLVNAQPCKI